MKGFLWVSFVALAGLGWGQTPPIQPKTPDVKVPPPLVLPPPLDVTLGKAPLTADEAVAIALAHQPDVGIARAGVVGARGRVEQARSDLRPQFSAGAGWSRSQSIRAGSTGPASSASVTVTQLLFDFGQTRAGVRQQQALLRATEFNLTRTEQTVALDVRTAFYDLSQSLALVTISEGNLANRRRQLDEAQARLDSSLGAPSDVVQAKTNLAEAAISLTNAQVAALTARIGLAQRLGIDPRTPLTPADSSEPSLKDEASLEALVGAAMAQRPDVKGAQARVVAARYGVGVAQKGNLPRVTVSAGVNARGEQDPLTTQNGALGVSLTWNFADSGFTAGRVEEAKSAEAAARLDLISTSQQVVAEVGRAFVDLQSAQARAQVAETEVANAEEFLRMAEGRFTGGIGTFLEAVNAQSSLFGAQRNLIQARQDVQRARAALRAAVGG